ncbi:MAG: type II toxin-antitoxin system HicA family toxin [Spirochaetia bacterium]|nr:type II toxin-antitoxin system HicA family toxin [Spirochaetia bacterium]
MPISGKEMVKKYKKAGWIILRQRGSHVRMGKDDARTTIPLHNELAKGTESVLLKGLEEV